MVFWCLLHLMLEALQTWQEPRQVVAAKSRSLLGGCQGPHYLRFMPLPSMRSTKVVRTAVHVALSRFCTLVLSASLISQ